MFTVEGADKSPLMGRKRQHDDSSQVPSQDVAIISEQVEKKAKRKKKRKDLQENDLPAPLKEAKGMHCKREIDILADKTIHGLIF